MQSASRLLSSLATGSCFVMGKAELSGKACGAAGSNYSISVSTAGNPIVTGPGQAVEAQAHSSGSSRRGRSSHGQHGSTCFGGSDRSCRLNSQKLDIEAHPCFLIRGIRLTGAVYQGAGAPASFRAGQLTSVFEKRGPK